MTQTTQSTTPELLIQLIRSILKDASDQQLGPVLLVDDVSRKARQDGVRTNKDAVRVAMFTMLKNGDVVWTKAGPIRLRSMRYKKGEKHLLKRRTVRDNSRVGGDHSR